MVIFPVRGSVGVDVAEFTGSYSYNGLQPKRPWCRQNHALEDGIDTDWLSG